MMRCIGLLICFMLSLSACSKSDTKVDSEKYITVQKESLTDSLFYSGNIQPLKTTVITSPADGIIVNMPFEYGDMVQANSELFEITSEKFLSDYKTAFMQYLKAKSDFDSASTQLSEGKFLHKNELISDDDFKSKESNFYAAQLALLQAKDALQIYLHDLNLKDVDFYKLTIADIDKITNAMHLKINAENLSILSPANGIMLGQLKGDENKKFNNGDAVKQGDVLAIIGDMTGLSVKVKVNEMTINQLQIGQAVTVTGLAFPDFVLHGKIASLDRQGEISGSDMPTFSIEVIVPTLTEAERKEIHVGMTAKVQIAMNSHPEIVIPITAVQEKDGQAFVKILRKHQLAEKMVTTGKTTQDSVTITSGLNVGDKILAFS